MTVRGKTLDYVIANQSADWCGNPFSPYRTVHYTLAVGMRIPVGRVRNARPTDLVGIYEATPVTSVTGSE